MPAGTALIRSEYLIDNAGVNPVDDDVAENSHSGENQPIKDDSNDEEPAHKKRRLSGAQRKKEAKEKRHGANKGRKFVKARDEIQLCWKVASGGSCNRGENCKFSHDIQAYLTAKPPDIYFPRLSELSSVKPFALTKSPDPTSAGESLTTCPIFEETGRCRYGLRCRYLGGHVSKGEHSSVYLVEDPLKEEAIKVDTTELNTIRPGLLKSLRTREYSTPIADAYAKELRESDGNPDATEINPQESTDTPNIPTQTVETGDTPSDDTYSAFQGDGDVPLRPAEKKRLHWEAKTYLAPLTTVGNLPFRRLCVSLGADITCSEMGLASSFLSASGAEWSLVRRHPSESTFGVQLCGSKPAQLTTAAEVIAKECAGNIDFVDLNCGCPIDLIFNQGSGSALMNAATKLGKIVVGMNRALGEIPLTVKLRTGVKDGHNTAHKLMPRLGHEWGVGGLAIHGRTRQQRYSKLADWDYISQCVKAVREATSDADLAPIPIFGGGDCFSSQGYWDCVNSTGVDGVMVARGALIKPWIFTEIKEHREWDISSRERLELVRKYAEYGLSHFGADTVGVNTTRRFLCEALSFQYRYIPIGLLERLPGKINDRPPAFRGRDELENLLASPDSRDWVKISEMFLGKPPDDWIFTPKHRSNAYDGLESQG